MCVIHVNAMHLFDMVSFLLPSPSPSSPFPPQVKELSSSDILSRVRDGYASAQTQSKELHDHQIATLKGEIDAIRCASDAKVRRGGGDGGGEGGDGGGTEEWEEVKERVEEEGEDDAEYYWYLNTCMCVRVPVLD